MPKFQELFDYCENSGWERFRTNNYHWFRKVQDDGRVLITKVDLTMDKEIPDFLWIHILKNQLQISEVEFLSGN
ncbi:MAG: type II toxin-antitoxin system HicA family toxin [Spirochaetia bacterium]